MTKIKLLETERDLWADYISEAPDSVSYHQIGWKEIIEKSFGHKTYYLMAVGGKKIKGVLPLAHLRSRLFGNFLVSLPFLNYAGIIADNENIAGRLLKYGIGLAEQLGVEFMELRHLGHKLPLVSTKTHKVTMVLDLDRDTASQWKAFNAKLRNQIRKAEKSGLRIRIGGSEEVREFYNVFCRNMRDLGTPVYGVTFFENVLDRLSESARIFRVTTEDMTIAAGICVWFKDTLEMPWASSLKTYRRFCPNNLLYWEAIKFAIENGFRRFDFGRSTPGEGTYKFKEQWGAKPTQLYWQYWSRNGSAVADLSPKNPRFSLAIRTWQKLPVSLTKILGPKIVRSIP